MRTSFLMGAVDFVLGWGLSCMVRKSPQMSSPSCLPFLAQILSCLGDFVRVVIHLEDKTRRVGVSTQRKMLAIAHML